MRHLQIAELRGSWRAWLSVFVVFVAANFSLMLLSLSMTTVLSTPAGPEGDNSALGMMSLVIMNFVMCIPAAIMVISSATKLVVNSRRGSVARLALAGAAPGQIVSTITVQLIVVSLAASLLGGILAALAIGPLIAYLVRPRPGEAPIVLADPVINVPAMLLCALGCALLAVLGGTLQASLATQIPPVEALREAAAPSQPKRLFIGRWIGFVLLMLAIVATLVGVLSYFKTTPYQKGDIIVMSSLLVLMLTVGALAQITPMAISPLTRWWTGLVPTKSPVWHLARLTVITKAERLWKTLVPLTLAISLPVGLLLILDSFTLVIERQNNEKLSGSGLEALLLFIGLPFLIALSGAVGNLIMMARARDAELALDSLAGATPRQQRQILVAEAGIIFGTAFFAALASVLVMLAYLFILMQAAYGEIFFDLTGEVWIVVAFIAVLCLVTTVLPSLKALNEPAPKVIARLIAD